MTVAIRGATTVDENDKEMIYSATEEMMRELFDLNAVKIEDVVSIVFTATSDLDKAYPAVAVRKMGITEAALMCVQELYVKGSLRNCIRVMVTVEGDYKRDALKHVYLRNAVGLRPDLKR
ncbi:Chorismate mutase AroH [bioreactor metagenome]|uniref:Chorismate mutase AroH n=1 Tax=bioreactor metagenome TaxID=1076179 RepID=A0A644X7P6_9ZZZZ|nr:chorismate mutase [Candidatus Metalachnospira sp.]